MNQLEIVAVQIHAEKLDGNPNLSFQHHGRVFIKKKVRRRAV